MLAYLNQLFSERYKQWKSDLHQYFLMFDDPQVALNEGCLKEFEDREDSWVWLCSCFHESGYVKKVKANNINQEKKTLLHHSGLRPFPYRMEALRKGCLKFREIDIFADVYVRPRDELIESFHATMVEKGQLVVQEFASQLPLDMPIEYVDPLEDVGFHILIETLNQTFG
ncbi:uncharacterized protein [Malus domestica]|uniref:uncharacterized protein n=1 Tax=Malus domestica TaxID=3750 RepID=UPI00397617AE